MAVDQSGPTFEFEQNADYCVLALKPSMNDAQWSDIEKAGDDIVKQIEGLNAPNLIADLSELDYIGSSMVALVVRIWKIVKAKKARMVVVNRNPMVLEVFKISKLDEVWTITDYREDALYELGVSPEAKSERRELKLLAIVSLVIAIIGAIGLGLHLTQPGLLDLRTTQVLAYGCSGLGMILGLLLLFKGKGGRRALGITAMLISVAVFWGAIFNVPLTAQAEKDEKQSDPKDAKNKSPNGEKKPIAGKTEPANDNEKSNPKPAPEEDDKPKSPPVPEENGAKPKPQQPAEAEKAESPEM